MFSVFGSGPDDVILTKIKRLMECYGVLFTFLILMLAIMPGTSIQPGLYLVLLIAFTATLSLNFLPIHLLARVIPLSIGTYIIFIHTFLSYIGEAHNQYKPLYLLPMVLASFLFGYFGAFITFIMTFFSHIILESNTGPTVPSYVHLIVGGLPFFTIAALLSLTALFIARILKEDKENLSSLLTARINAEEALTRELETIKMLHNTDRAILSSIDRKEVLKICVINLRALINAEYVSIATLEEEDIFRLEISSLNGILEEHEDMVPLQSTILNRSVSSKASRYYPEVYPDDLLDCDMDIRDKGVRRLLIVPLIAKGIPLGTLNIGRLESSGFSREDIDLAEKYALQVAIAIDNSNLYEGMQNLFMNTITSLSSAIDAKSHWTQNHSECVAEYAVAIAGELSLDETFTKDLKIAVLLHDIGKIGINDTIINKPTSLTAEEQMTMNGHPLKGAIILEPIKELKRIIPIIRHHHERWDGTGYPDNLSGNMIPLGARILSVADTFEAMTTNRPYRKRLTPEEAKKELRKCSETQFDPQIVDALLAYLMSMEETL